MYTIYLFISHHSLWTTCNFPGWSQGATKGCIPKPAPGTWWIFELQKQCWRSFRRSISSSKAPQCCSLLQPCFFGLYKLSIESIYDISFLQIVVAVTVFAWISNGIPMDSGILQACSWFGASTSQAPFCGRHIISIGVCWTWFSNPCLFHLVFKLTHLILMDKGCIDNTWFLNVIRLTHDSAILDPFASSESGMGIKKKLLWASKKYNEHQKKIIISIKKKYYFCMRKYGKNENTKKRDPKKRRNEETKQPRHEETKKRSSQDTKKRRNEETKQPRNEETKKQSSQETKKRRNEGTKTRRNEAAETRRNQGMKKAKHKDTKKRSIQTIHLISFCLGSLLESMNMSAMFTWAKCLHFGSSETVIITIKRKTCASRILSLIPFWAMSGFSPIEFTKAATKEGGRISNQWREGCRCPARGCGCFWFCPGDEGWFCQPWSPAYSGRSQWFWSGWSRSQWLRTWRRPLTLQQRLVQSTRWLFPLPRLRALRMG